MYKGNNRLLDNKAFLHPVQLLLPGLNPVREVNHPGIKAGVLIQTTAGVQIQTGDNLNIK